MCVLPKRDGAQQYSSGFRHKQRSSINSTLECTDQAAAMNGASDFTVEIFGEVGKHIRTSAGVASLPMGFAASVYMIVEAE